MGKFLRPWMLLALLLVAALAAMSYSRAYSDSFNSTSHVNIATLGGAPINTGAGLPLGGTQRVVVARDNTVNSITYYSVDGDNSTYTGNAGPNATLYDLIITNTTPDVMYVKVYDLAGASDCSGAFLHSQLTALPNQTTVVPFGPKGMMFSDGIAFCIVGQPGPTDDTPVTAGLSLTVVAGNQ